MGGCGVMSQSLTRTNSNTSGLLSQSILSEPNMIVTKSPTPSLPTLPLTEDLNANQSL